jgi:hypothetical protein
MRVSREHGGLNPRSNRRPEHAQPPGGASALARPPAFPSGSVHEGVGETPRRSPGSTRPVRGGRAGSDRAEPTPTILARSARGPPAGCPPVRPCGHILKRTGGTRLRATFATTCLQASVDLKTVRPCATGGRPGSGSSSEGGRRLVIGERLSHRSPDAPKTPSL